MNPSKQLYIATEFLMRMTYPSHEWLYSWNFDSSLLHLSLSPSASPCFATCELQGLFFIIKFARLDKYFPKIQTTLFNLYFWNLDHAFFILKDKKVQVIFRFPNIRINLCALDWRYHRFSDKKSSKKALHQVF